MKTSKSKTKTEKKNKKYFQYLSLEKLEYLTSQPP